MRKILLVALFSFLAVSSLHANHEMNCAQPFKEKGVCPESICEMRCISSLDYEGCEMGCLPKPCPEIDVNKCPKDSCQVLKGCDKKDVCYYIIEPEPIECGDTAYSGQAVECCEGLTKKCGIEFFDGSCDMVGEKSMYSVPICVPCGNGICNQFENRCNCPEDCSPEE